SKAHRIRLYEHLRKYKKIIRNLYFVLNKKIMTKQGSNLLMLLKNLKLMSSYQKSYLQPQNST
ncbi:hypothetical protein ACLVPB_04985, partial [Streptococcus pneumoniae]